MIREAARVLQPGGRLVHVGLHPCFIGAFADWSEPGRADALNTLGEPPPDEWMRRLGTLPLVHQPGERWMYDTAANVTGVLIARATGMSFGDALRERICDPLGMTDTAFTVGGESIGRLATAYERDNAVTGEPVVQTAPTGSGAGRSGSSQVAAGSSRPPTTTSPSLRRCSPAGRTTANGCSRGHQSR